MSSVNRLRDPMTRHTEAIIIYDESSSPGVDDYLIDDDRTTLRFSTGYPIETYL